LTLSREPSTETDKSRRTGAARRLELPRAKNEIFRLPRISFGPPRAIRRLFHEQAKHISPVLRAPYDPLREREDDDKGLTEEQIRSLRGIKAPEPVARHDVEDRIDFLLEHGRTIEDIRKRHPEWFSDSLHIINAHDDWQTHHGHDMQNSDFQPEE
jgi:hypothetical protein